MAAVAQDFSSSSSPATAKTSVPHPLCPLTAAEISTTADLLRSVWPSNIDLRFKVITLDEPAKKQMVPYLEAEHSGAPLPQIPRKSFVSYYIRNTVSSPSTQLWRMYTVPALTLPIGPLP
jgi:primary-amine oxidase